MRGLEDIKPDRLRVFTKERIGYNFVGQDMLVRVNHYAQNQKIAEVYEVELKLPREELSLMFDAEGFLYLWEKIRCEARAYRAKLRKKAL